MHHLEIGFSLGGMLMKRIGILGGTSPESTVTYYSTIIHEYTKEHNDQYYPEVLIYSVSFQKIIDWVYEKRMDLVAQELSRGLNLLSKIGADFGLVAAVTLHIVFDEVSKSVNMPLLSLIDVTSEAIQKDGYETVGLMGTLTTMRNEFFRSKLYHHGITTLVPDEKMQEEIDRILFTEAARGIIKDESRQVFLEIVDYFDKLGVDGVILGCTEIPLLLQQNDTDIPLYDTTFLHAKAALEHALKE
jgi:aspartate racemase